MLPERVDHRITLAVDGPQVPGGDAHVTHCAVRDTIHITDIPTDVDFEKEVKPYLLRELGHGGYGIVYSGVWRGRSVAVKV